MTSFELNNNQRQYFGLNPVLKNWDKIEIDIDVFIYFDNNKIVKVLKYQHGYLEYDVEINTKNRQIILPQTNRGKEQNLTGPRVLKVKGSGMQFSGSFHGGGVTVYDHKRNLFVAKSYQEEGQIRTYSDIEKWIDEYIKNSPSDYFEWLEKQEKEKRQKIQAKEGDIIAFNIGRNEFGFARILFDVYLQYKDKKSDRLDPRTFGFHPRSLVIAPYAFYSNTLDINLKDLVKKKTLPSLCIFDIDVYRGENPIIGNIPLTEEDKQIPFPQKNGTSFSIHLSKSDIEEFIKTSEN